MSDKLLGAAFGLMVLFLVVVLAVDAKWKFDNRERIEKEHSEHMARMRELHYERQQCCPCE